MIWTIFPTPSTPASDTDNAVSDAKRDELRWEVEQARNHGSSWLAQEEQLGRVSKEIHTGIGNARRMNAIGKFADAPPPLEQHAGFFIDYRYLVSPRSAATGIMANTRTREQLFHLAATASEIIGTLPAKPLEANIKQLGNSLAMPVTAVKQQFGKDGAERFVQTVAYIGRFLHHRFAAHVCGTLNKHIRQAARTAQASAAMGQTGDIATPAAFQTEILQELAAHPALSILAAARLPFGSEEVRTRQTARLLNALVHHNNPDRQDSLLWALLPQDGGHDADQAGYYSRDNVAARLHWYVVSEIAPYYDGIRQNAPDQSPGFDVLAVIQEYGITPDMVGGIFAQFVKERTVLGSILSGCLMNKESCLQVV